MQDALRADSRAAFNAGSNIPARIAMIAITTVSQFIAKQIFLIIEFIYIFEIDFFIKQVNLSFEQKRCFMKKFLYFLLIIFAMLLRADDNFKWMLNNGNIVLEVADKCYLYLDSVKIDAVDAKTAIDLIKVSGISIKGVYTSDTYERIY